MDKKLYKECIYKEVYEPYYHAKNRLTILDKIWCKYISPESNAVYLVRKKQLLESRGYKRALSRFYHAYLIKKYGIHINPQAEIGIGFRIVHPIGIVISYCKIGENFTVYQNCTIGAKKIGCGLTPTIGNDVTMYANSSIIGGVEVADHVTIAAHACLVDDASESGTYCGIPARLKLKKQ